METEIKNNKEINKDNFEKMEKNYQNIIIEKEFEEERRGLIKKNENEINNIIKDMKNKHNEIINNMLDNINELELEIKRQNEENKDNYNYIINDINKKHNDDLDDCDKEGNNDWTEEAYGFINEVIFGIEKEVYKKGMENAEIKKTLQQTGGMLIGSRLLEFYLTKVYRQLVEKSNDIKLDKFIRMGKICTCF